MGVRVVVAVVIQETGETRAHIYTKTKQNKKQKNKNKKSYA